MLQYPSGYLSYISTGGSGIGRPASPGSRARYWERTEPADGAEWIIRFAGL